MKVIHLIDNIIIYFFIFLKFYIHEGSTKSIQSVNLLKFMLNKKKIIKKSLKSFFGPWTRALLVLDTWSKRIGCLTRNFAWCVAQSDEVWSLVLTDFRGFLV